MRSHSTAEAGGSTHQRQNHSKRRCHKESRHNADNHQNSGCAAEGEGGGDGGETHANRNYFIHDVRPHRHPRQIYKAGCRINRSPMHHISSRRNPPGRRPQTNARTSQTGLSHHNSRRNGKIRRIHVRHQRTVRHHASPIKNVYGFDGWSMEERRTGGKGCRRLHFRRFAGRWSGNGRSRDGHVFCASWYGICSFGWQFKFEAYES
mmetsp:Transcript_649/g.1183  ORF Transcript_649/g.1183 Transcript_649/m.1183 type:complete len:206 (-) Transcript_649:481-1098(-)